MRLLFFIAFIATLTISAQNKYSKKFSINTDNDLYVSTFRDRYYTSGLFFDYHYTANTTKHEKKIYAFQLAHKMFTPFKAVVEHVNLHDRPFAGLLYGKFGITWALNKKTLLNLNTELGVIGPAAVGEDLQDFIHDIYGFKKAIGWKQQIKNAIALNLKASYTKSLFTDKNNIFNISWINNASVGTVFTHIATGFNTRLGIKKLQAISNTAAFNTNLNNNHNSFLNHTELFIFAKPKLQLSLYDATIQGSFLSPNSPVTYEINPVVFSCDIGATYVIQRFSFTYSLSYHSKKLKNINVPKWNNYGSINVSYSFN